MAVISLALVLGILVYPIVKMIKNQIQRDSLRVEPKRSQRDEILLRQIEAREEAQKQANEKVAELKRQANEAKVRELNFKIYRARKDIEYIEHQMEEKRKYGEFLELNRDSCVYGSKYYHNWNNKMTANNNQLHTLETQLDKAMNIISEAEIKIGEVM